MSDEFPSRLLEKVVVRLPDGVREMLKIQADANKRSMNAEIVARLLESLEPWKPGDDPHRQAVTKRVFEPTNFDIKDIAFRLQKIEEALARSDSKIED